MDRDKMIEKLEMRRVILRRGLRDMWELGGETRRARRNRRDMENRWKRRLALVEDLLSRRS